MKSPFNPLVVRYVRTGFRRGKGSFQIGVTGAILFLIVLINVVLFLARDSMPSPYTGPASFARGLFYQLLAFNAIHLIVLGLFRIYGSSQREKNEGTLEFLRISTLSPWRIVWGMAFGLQVPGYLLLVITLPIAAVCVAMGAAPFSAFLLVGLVLVAAAVLFSLVGLELGLLYEKRSADTLIALLMIGFIWSTPALLQIPGGGPSSALRLLALLNPAVVGVDLVRGSGNEALFFGKAIPDVWLALVLYGFLSVVLARKLVDWLEHGRYAKAGLGGSLLAFAGLLVLVYGFSFDPLGGLPAWNRAVALGVGAVFLFGFATTRATHWEPYLLSRTEGVSATGPRHPLLRLYRDAAPYFAIYIAADAFCALLGDGEVDLLAPVTAAALIAALVAVSLAGELGSRREPGRTTGMGFFWLLTLAPIALALLAGGAFDSPRLASGLLGLSPPGVAVVLAARDELAESIWLPALLGTAAGAALLIFALGAVASQGHYARLEREVAVMRRAAGAEEG